MPVAATAIIVVAATGIFIKVLKIWINIMHYAIRAISACD